jgi:hypothetical protein
MAAHQPGNETVEAFARFAHDFDGEAAGKLQ